ncbi:toll-like receptor 8 [Diadema antillarum]|uniref:toll-like receptor 8 n=1 Tax=Diadema antillarum TaxID=105358 RepID=UPI003A8B4898
MNATTVLFLSSCGISRLTTPDAPGILMPELLNLHLENNALIEIRANEFVGFPKLRHLSLSYNNIRYINLHAFSGLENLLRIHLNQNNLIDNLGVNVFQNLPSLRVLDISESKITSLNPRQSLSGLTVLEELLLQGNNLHVSDLCNAERYVSLFQDMHNLQNLDLSRNLFRDGFPPSCFKDLRNIRRLYLRSASLSALQPNLFDSLRYLETLSLDDNILQELPSSIFSFQSNLATLYISRNQISSLPTPLMSNLKNLSHLLLARTDVSVLPEDEFSSLLANIDVIDLSYNSLSCSCKNAWFRNWVHANYDKVFLSSTKCSRDSPREFSGKRFIDFDPTLLCGPKVLMYVGISITSGVTIICTILIYYYRWWIRYKLFLLKLWIIGYTEVIDDNDYKYDINIVFHDDNEKWVLDYLVPKLRDREPEAELCVGDDDFTAGMPWIEAIADVIDNSYKSVFIVTNAAISNGWYMTKLRLAVQHINSSKRDAILLIFLEDIDDKNMPYTIRVLMGVNRPYLLWSDDPRYREYFWDELMKTVWKTVKIDFILPI